MIENRLELLDKELSVRLEKASNSQKRNAAKVACRFALERNSLSDPILDEGLKALELGNYGNSSLRLEIESFINHLDDIQWNLQEKMDESSTKLLIYLAAFHRSHAANSVYYALDANAFVAATESIYEAYAATEDLTKLKAMILAKLESKSANTQAASSQITSL